METSRGGSDFCLRYVSSRGGHAGHSSKQGRFALLYPVRNCGCLGPRLDCGSAAYYEMRANANRTTASQTPRRSSRANNRNSESSPVLTSRTAAPSRGQAGREGRQENRRLFLSHAEPAFEPALTAPPRRALFLTSADRRTNRKSPRGIPPRQAPASLRGVRAFVSDSQGQRRAPAR